MLQTGTSLMPLHKGDITMNEKVYYLTQRLDALEALNRQILTALPTLLEGFTLPILASITVDPSTDPSGGSRKDSIEKKRTKKCRVTVTVSVKYSEMLNVWDKKEKGKDKKRKVIGHSYKVETTITVVEQCNGDRREKGKSTHTTRKTYLIGENDTPKSGSTKSFSGTETDTLTYPHGTKVKVVTKDETVKVDITYADETTDTLTIPTP